jgi:hypothetical protein
MRPQSYENLSGQLISIFLHDNMPSFLEAENPVGVFARCNSNFPAEQIFNDILRRTSQACKRK